MENVGFGKIGLLSFTSLTIMRISAGVKSPVDDVPTTERSKTSFESVSLSIKILVLISPEVLCMVNSAGCSRKRYVNPSSTGTVPTKNPGGSPSSILNIRSGLILS